MTHVSASQPADIVQANARDLRQSVGEVHSDVLPLFGAVAERPGLLLSDPSAVPPQLRAWWDAGRELHQSTRAH